MTDENITNEALRNHIRATDDQTAIAHGRITELADRLDSFVQSPPDRSELYAALAKAQGEIQAAETNQTAEVRKKDDYSKVLYTFKYADLASCLEAIRKPLSDNGLALIQLPSLGENNAVHMKTVLGHESGQHISCNMTMYPDNAKPQAIGTCMSYLRRYSLSSMIGVAQFDDDGTMAAQTDPNDYPRISVAEVEKIIYHADELFDDHADDAVKLMLERVFNKIAVVGDIREGEMGTAITYLDNAKKARDKRLAKAKKDEAAEAKAAKEEK